VADSRTRVLLVEDDDDTRTFLIDLFESDGWEVRAAPDPEAARAGFREFAPDLAVLDVMLPRESGFDVYRRAKEAGKVPPVIFITAKPTDLPRLYAKQLGADGFFRKPFEADALLACARAAAARARAARAA
jgi:two-component system OmpR family response regulator